MRLQLALNVRNLEEAVGFYSKLFNARPHKTRPGYANFAIESPPLKLVLFENPNAKERLNHLGVEVFEQSEVDLAEQRFAKEQILEATEQDSVCCHASQNKAWVREPQGLRWEWYRILDDNPTSNEASCCVGEPSDANSQSSCCT